MGFIISCSQKPKNGQNELRERNGKKALGDESSDTLLIVGSKCGFKFFRFENKNKIVSYTSMVFYYISMHIDSLFKIGIYFSL